MKILVVDDELVSRKKLVLYAEKLGYEVLTAKNGLEAWDIWQKMRPRIVVTDWIMPEMTGLELCTRIREQEGSEYTYIVVVTVQDSSGEMIKGMEAGADDYVAKPFNKDDLFFRLKAGERIIRLQIEVEGLNKSLEQRVADRTIQLVGAQKLIVEKEHKADMADIATGTLHNIGNMVNSIKTSAYIISEVMKTSTLFKLNKANDMLRENIETIEDFICGDPKGKKLLTYYLKLEESFSEEHGHIQEHLDRLNEKVKAITEVITPQQNYARDTPKLEKCNLEKIIEDALEMQLGSKARHEIRIVKNISSSSEILALKTKLMHIIVNLIKNSKEAMRDIPAGKKELAFTIDSDHEAVYARVRDTGHGISKEDQKKMFSYGFTTKADGHGFGLHSSASYMVEMGGTLSVESKGYGEGATFVLKFPISKV